MITTVYTRIKNQPFLNLTPSPSPFYAPQESQTRYQSGYQPERKKKKKNRETKDAIVVPVRLPLSCKTPKLLLPFYNAIA